MTIAFGHGLAVAPLQALMAVGALVNGGTLITPTFLKRDARTPRGVEAIAGDQARDQRGDALRHAPQRARRARPRKAAIAGLLRRRQDRHGREGDRRPLLQEPALHDLHGRRARRQAALPLPHHHGRAAGAPRDLWLRHGRLERRPVDRQHHRARRAAARRAAALRAAGPAVPADGAHERLGASR